MESSYDGLDIFSAVITSFMCACLIVILALMMKYTQAGNTPKPIPDENYTQERKNTFIYDKCDPNYFTNVLKALETCDTVVKDTSFIRYDATATEYNFNHPKRGYAIIINNVNFDESLPYLIERKGSDVDAGNLFVTLKKMEFDVKIFKNCRAVHIKEIIMYFAALNHYDRDCFVCIVMSHGECDNVIGTDGENVSFEDLAEPFKKTCPSLLGKPKIFIVQACRGSNLDPGIDLPNYCSSVAGMERSISIENDEVMVIESHDEADNVRPLVPVDGVLEKIPKEADFLWVYATPLDYKAWRRQKNGTPFIAALVDAIHLSSSSHMNFVHVLTYANNILSQYLSRISEKTLEENPLMKSVNNKKQCASYSSRLTKDIYFRPKYILD